MAAQGAGLRFGPYVLAISLSVSARARLEVASLGCLFALCLEPAFRTVPSAIDNAVDGMLVG